MKTTKSLFGILTIATALAVQPIAGHAQAINQVLSLDGTSAYVSVPTAPDLQNPSEITIEAWIYPQQGNQNNTVFINKSDNLVAGSDRSYELQWVANADSAGPGKSVRFIVFLNNGNWTWVDAVAAENTWVHIAGCFSSTLGVLQIFTNGVLAEMTTEASGIPLSGTLLRQTTFPVRFGRAEVSPYFYARGFLDEVRIWSKARAQTEIRESLYCRLSGSEPNLAAYWNFDAGTAADLTGHGHDGTLSGNAAMVPITGEDVVHAGCGLPGLQTYSVIDIGTFGGIRADNNTTSSATAINNAGVIAGVSFVTNGGYHGYLYTNGPLFDIGTLGQRSCHAAAINNSSAVCGFIGNSVLGDEGSIIHAFAYSNGVMTDLAPMLPTSQKSLAAAINNLAQVVGWYIDGATSKQRAFIYSNGIVQDLGIPDGFATDINDSGHIVGTERVPGGDRVFLISGGQKQLLDSLGNASAGRINNSEQIVGNHSLGNGVYHAYLYQNGQVHDLGTLGGANSQAFALNNLGLVVGQSDTAEGAIHAYIYRNGAMLDLNKLIPTNSGWVLTQAYGINDRGLIVGNGTFQGQRRGFLLIPTQTMPRTATASPILTNGFVVGATITDAGSGYTNTPVVRIVGGGGSGAQAVAVVSNGVVTDIQIIDAGSGYTNQPVIIIDPPFIEPPKIAIAALSLLSFTNLSTGTNYQLQVLQSDAWNNLDATFTASGSAFTQHVPGTAEPQSYRLVPAPAPSQAYATAQVINGFVVGITVTEGGSGYTTNPAVTIRGAGGSNATATAFASGGSVINITVTSAGIGYANTPTVVIAQPPADALWPTVTQVIKLDLERLAPYHGYQLEFKPAVTGLWGNIDVPFTPTSTTNTQYINVSGDAGFIRAKHVP